MTFVNSSMFKLMNSPKLFSSKI